MLSNHIVFSGISSTCVRPQLKDLVLIQTTEWYDLGLQLGIEDAKLEEIQSNNPKSVRTCRREMFRAWLRITPSPSYQQLVEALLALGEINEADWLHKKYGKIIPVLEVKNCLDIQYSIFIYWWSFILGIQLQHGSSCWSPSNNKEWTDWHGKWN